MKSCFGLGLAMLAGVALGAIATGGIGVTTLHAQSKPAAYAIVDISEISKPDLFKTLLPKAGPAIQAYGGQFVIRTENITALDGTPPKRFVVLAFESVAKAKGWNDSAAQQEVNQIRANSTTSRSFIAEGMQ